MVPSRFSLAFRQLILEGEHEDCDFCYLTVGVDVWHKFCFGEGWYMKVTLSKLNKAMIQRSTGNVRWLLLMNTLLDCFAFWL